MADQYKVVYDRLSLPMIKTPTGDILRVQMLENGHWTHDPMDPARTYFVVEACNLLLEKNRKEKV